MGDSSGKEEEAQENTSSVSTTTDSKSEPPRNTELYSLPGSDMFPRGVGGKLELTEPVDSIDVERDYAAVVGGDKSHVLEIDDGQEEDKTETIDSNELRPPNFPFAIEDAADNVMEEGVKTEEVYGDEGDVCHRDEIRTRKSMLISEEEAERVTDVVEKKGIDDLPEVNGDVGIENDPEEMEVDEVVGVEIQALSSAEEIRDGEEAVCVEASREGGSPREGVAELEEREVVEELQSSDVAEETEGEDEEGPSLEAIKGKKMDRTEVLEDTEEGEDGMETAEEEEGMETAEETAEGEDGIEIADETGVENEVTEMPEETATDVVRDEMETAGETEDAEDAEELEEVTKSVDGRRKRGRKPKLSVAKVPARKKGEEDVCFICFDGGELVLCDRRGCPKAYHPTCVGLDETVFSSKGKWNCGLHQCNHCGKNTYYMCYTCTFSLCKRCIKDAVILCVRGNRGFCEPCMLTVKMIESNELENNEMPSSDDISSREYLFKDYWAELKEKLLITSEELAQAKNPWRGANRQESSYDPNDADNNPGSGSDMYSNAEQAVPKRRKTRSQSKSVAREEGSSNAANRRDIFVDDDIQWASNELLEVVMHMKNGDKSFLPQSEIHNLLLEYITKYNLRDPRRKSQVICDSRLQSLFGKPSVGHFEMLNLLDSHILMKEDSHVDNLQGSDVEATDFETDKNSDIVVKTGKDKRRGKRKKGEGRGRQSNIDDYAAIDMHNINLIYLRRNLVEDILEDPTTFHEKVVGCFARIRISGNQKQDIYRLVQVVGTSKVAEPYKVGKKTTDFLLEILNLDKAEVISVDIISNQEFTEDECKRLRQSIKCGLIDRLTLGDIQEKAMALQEARVKDWMEAEILRLNHLCDRASDLGRRKELRECVEKLQLLKSPEERQRRVEEIPEIHVDPKMDPDYESEEVEEKTEDNKQEKYLRPRGSSFSRRGRDQKPPGRDFSSSNSWSGTRNYSNTSRELSRNMSGKGLSIKGDDDVGTGKISENFWGSERIKDIREKKTISYTEVGAKGSHSGATQESYPRVVSEISPPPPTDATPAASQINELEKMWLYRDPSGKVQGPFSIVQLRKWNNTGYFPAGLKIWTNEKEHESVLLTNALAGKFHVETLLPDKSSSKVHMGLYSSTVLSSPGQPAKESLKSLYALRSEDIPKLSQDAWVSETNLPSPTPNQTTTPEKKQALESKWSPTNIQPSASLLVGNRFLGGNAALHSAPQSSLQTSGVGQGSNIPYLVKSAPNQMQSEPRVPIETLRIQVNTNHFLPNNSPTALTNAANAVSRIEMMAPSPTPGSGSQDWGNSPSQKLLAQSDPVSLPTPPASYSRLGDNSLSNQNSLSSFPPADSWRLQVPNQTNVQTPTAPLQQSWVTGFSDNRSNAQRQELDNRNINWGPSLPVNPNPGWGGPLPATNTNINRGNPNPGWTPSGQGQPHGNANPGWAAPGQGQGHGNTNPGWIVPGQGQARINPNNSWSTPNQGQAPGNAMTAWTPANGNSGWAATTQNQGFRGAEQNQNGDRFSGPRDRVGDSGYGRGTAWNRQSSFGSGGSRPSFQSQRVCKFYRETGYCKKGAQCDYLHT